MTSQESYGKTIKNEKTNTTKEEEKDLNFCEETVVGIGNYLESIKKQELVSLFQGDVQ